MATLALQAVGVVRRHGVSPAAVAVSTGDVAAATCRSLTASLPSASSPSDYTTATALAIRHSAHRQLPQRAFSAGSAPRGALIDGLPRSSARSFCSSSQIGTERGGAAASGTPLAAASGSSPPGSDASGEARTHPAGPHGHHAPPAPVPPASTTASPNTKATTPSSAPPPSSPGSSLPSPSAAPGTTPAAAAPSSLLVVRGAAVQSAADRVSSALLAHAVDLGVKLNQLTGYNVIEQLKAKVDDADQGLASAREQLRAGRALYEARVAEHGEVQRQLMSLLQRKGSWGGADVERFAQLCRDEHGLEGGVAQAKAAYVAATEALEGAHAQLLRAIRERYSSETLWSDKIRRASTWWTAGLMGLHLVSFMSVYLVMEPIKARRLRDHVEGVLRLELTSVRQTVASLQAALESHVADLGSPATAAAAGGTAGGDPGGLQGNSADQAGPSLAGELLPELRQVRLHLAAVERRLGEASGARTAAAGVLAGSTARADEPHVPAARGDAGNGRGVTATGVADMEEGAAGVKGRATRWLSWTRLQLRRAASVPELTTGASAFAGAALGVGLLLMLKEHR